MNFHEFMDSLQAAKPPAEMEGNILALWYDKKGEWDKAHEIVQRTGGRQGDWIHAYLHRKEGDPGNASYWYAMVGKTRPNTSLNDEWEALVKVVLNA